MEYVFAASLTPASSWDEGETGFVVAFPDLPEAITQGETPAEALTAAADCLRLAVEVRLRHGEVVPEPSPLQPGEHEVALPTILAVKVALHDALRERNVTNVDLALQLGLDEREVRRMLDPGHATKLPRLEMALAALGRRVTLDIRRAA